MKRFAVSIAALLAATPLLALNLTPAQGFRELEGFKVPVVQFEDNGRAIRWQPPAKWQLSGGEGKLVLVAQDFAQATMELRVLKRPPDGRDQLPTMEQRQAWVLPFLPNDVREVSFAGGNENPFILNGQPSFEILVRYVSGARRFTASVSCVDLNERERLVVNVTARQDDFAAAHEAAIGSLFSWGWVND